MGWFLSTGRCSIASVTVIRARVEWEWEWEWEREARSVGGEVWTRTLSWSCHEDGFQVLAAALDIGGPRPRHGCFCFPWTSRRYKVPRGHTTHTTQLRLLDNWRAVAHALVSKLQAPQTYGRRECVQGAIVAVHRSHSKP